MSYIKIKHKELVNLKYALNKEVLRSNKTGSYASSTIIGCNTRKYHGLLVTPFSNGTKHVLLSELEETIIQKGNSFRLGIRRYPGSKYEPHGHTYLREFKLDPIPSKTYGVGGVVLKKDLLLVQEEERILIRYTIIDAHSQTTLRLQPFLAFREMHTLSKANMEVNTKVSILDNGVKIKMYQDYPYLFMQISRQNKFVSAPDWYYNIEYEKEQERGYEYSEDLFVPGFFDINVKKDDVIIFSAGITETNSKNLKRKFDSELNKRIPRNSFENNLINSAQQFFIYKKDETLLSAGFHWYGYCFREALIALPGLTMYNKNEKTFKAIFETLLEKIKSTEENLTLDIPLLLFRLIFQFVEHKGDYAFWRKYKKDLLKLFDNIKTGKYDNELHDNGLLYVKNTGIPATWMNEVYCGKPVNPRYGYISEVNALWFNVVMFISEASSVLNDKKTQEIIGNLPEQIEHFYKDVFWNDKEKNLYDFVDQYKNEDRRPNQIFAVSLPYSPLSDEMKKHILKDVKSNLLTERGLRTLSPDDSKYRGFCTGSVQERALSKHQGSIHPWLLGPFCEAWLNIYGKDGIDYIKDIYYGFEKVMNEHGLGTISEIYDSNPPYKAGGAISYAPSVGEILRIKMMIDSYSE